MKFYVVPVLVIAFVQCTTPIEVHDYDDEYLSNADGGSSASAEAPLPEGRILGGLLTGWKGEDGHPLTEFGKIHLIKKPGWGSGGGGVEGRDGFGQGWGWGQYGPGWTTTYHVTNKGWKGGHKKKSWLKFPKKSFGIHVKGGIGFSFGGKKKKGQTVVVQHHQPSGWGWNSGYGQGHGGWGWGQGHHGGFEGYGDYYDDDASNKEEQDDDEQDDDGGPPEDADVDDDDDRRRMMDLGTDYVYDY